jgi:hypothetical protein
MFQQIVLNVFLKPINSRIITAGGVDRIVNKLRVKIEIKKWISRILASMANSSIISDCIGCFKEVFHCIPIIIFSRKRLYSSQQFTNKEKKQIVNSGTRRFKIADDKFGTKYRNINVITPSSALSLIILYYFF